MGTYALIHIGAIVKVNPVIKANRLVLAARLDDSGGFIQLREFVEELLHLRVNLTFGLLLLRLGIAGVNSALLSLLHQLRV